MTVGGLLRLSWRESRTARRRLALYMSSIAFGVAALVAIDSFANNVTRSLRDQSRTLIGGDMVLQARATLPPLVDTLLDSLSLAGVQSARVTTFASMALAEPSGGTRLVQVRAVSEGFPFYGEMETAPVGLWNTVHGDTPLAFVDPSLLIALDAEVGDSIRLGNQFFRIAATLGDVPGDAGITAVIGPRVYIAYRWLPATGLLQFGSRADYEAVLKLPADAATAEDAESTARALLWRIDPRLAARRELSERERRAAEAEDDEAEVSAPSAIATTALRDTLRADSVRSANADPFAVPPTRVSITTAADNEEEFTEAVGELANFLSVIGLIALLLGGIGVASGVNAFVAAKIDTVAVLRCLGATSKQVLALYVTQSAAMGLVGATAGAMLGVAVQYLLPRVLGEFLPVDVSLGLEWMPILMGLATGVWVALVFALRPLLALRRISPLQAIRRDADDRAIPTEWKDGARLVVDGLLVGSIVSITIARIGDAWDGAGVAGGILLAVAVLWVAATLLIRVARRSVRPTWPFALRQGIANLYRPANQTRAVTLALGFGAFLLSTVYLMQSNLLGRVQSTADASDGNLLFFDVQQDQAAPLDSMLRVGGHEIVQSTPIVTMRIASVNGRTVPALLGDTTVRRARWALRREYRSTYRDTLVNSEELVAGTWFGDSATRQRERADNPDAPYAISMEQDVAQDMGVSLGDTITWNVQGVPVRTIVTSLRTVNWARFEANFFVVFAPEALRRAPQQHVFVANVEAGEPLALIQRDVVRRYPNISSLDLTLVRRTIGSIVDRVVLAIRFLGLFSLAMGVPVLFSAVAATRRARLREGVLLRTLGATRAQVARILLVEYGALGALGALTGMVLSFGGAWGLSRFIFEDTFNPAWLPAFVIAAGMLALTMGIGFLTSRDVYRETPMAAIRES